MDYEAICTAKSNQGLVRALASAAQGITSKSPFWHMPSEDPKTWEEMNPMEAFKAAETELLKRLGEPAPVYAAEAPVSKRRRR